MTVPASGRLMRTGTPLARARADGERVQLIGELDLEPVVYKLMCPEPGLPRLSLEQADRKYSVIPSR